ISHEGGELEDPWCEPSKQVWTMTVDPEDAPNIPERIQLSFEQGKLVAVNDEKLSPYQALVKLNTLAAAHGVGRIDIVENRLVGMKSRGCYETPGGTVLMAAYKALELLVLDKRSMQYR